MTPKERKMSNAFDRLRFQVADFIDRCPPPRDIATRSACAILGTLAFIVCIPLALVMLLPWRDPMGPGAAWAAVGAYSLMLAGVIAAVVFGG